MENQQNPTVQQKTIIVTQNKKSVALSLVLTFFFGPLGMLYSTVAGGIIMFFIAIVVGLFTFGIGLFFLWPIQMIWAAIAASNHNSKNNTQVINH